MNKKLKWFIGSLLLTGIFIGAGAYFKLENASASFTTILMSFGVLFSIITLITGFNLLWSLTKK